MAEPGTESKDVGLEEVAAAEVRDRLTELMNRANIANERIVLTRNGKQTAALVGIRDLERLRALDAESAQ